MDRHFLTLILVLFLYNQIACEFNCEMNPEQRADMQNASLNIIPPDVGCTYSNPARCQSQFLDSTPNCQLNYGMCQMSEGCTSYHFPFKCLTGECASDISGCPFDKDRDRSYLYQCKSVFGTTFERCFDG